MKLDKVTRLFLLSIAALLLYWLDSIIALPGALPGGLGLSLAVSLFALWVLNFREAGVLTLIWTLLGAMIFRGFDGFLYYGPSAILGFLTILGLRPVLKENQVWIAGCLASLVYGLSALILMIWLQRAPSFLLFFPTVMFYGMIAGLVMGLCVQFVIKKGNDLWKTIFK